MTSHTKIREILSGFLNLCQNFIAFSSRHPRKFLISAVMAGVALVAIQIYAPKGVIEIDPQNIVQINTAHGVGYTAQVNWDVKFPWEFDNAAAVFTENGKELINYAGVSDPDRVTAMGNGSFNIEQRKILRKGFGWQRLDGELVFVPFDQNDPRSSDHNFRLKVDVNVNSKLFLLVVIYISIIFTYVIQLNIKKNSGQALNINHILLILIFMIVVFYTSWISDDAAITLHSVLNFVHGYGPVLNIGERVQAFTHPLWFFINSAGWFLFHQVFFGALFLSIALSTVTYYIFIRYISPFHSSALHFAILLLGSKFYIEFSTSGLENPLSHLIIVCLSVIILSEKFNANKKFHYIYILLTLLYLTRSDLILLFLPFAFYFLYTYLRDEILTRNDKFKSLLKCCSFLLVAASPAIIWTGFSIFYYGFPFPNTAYVKIADHVPLSIKLNQGLLYIIDGFIFDPLTMCTILFGIFFGFRDNKKTAFISCGMILYLIYISFIGGDFMRGRFFTALFILSLCILSQIKIGKKIALAVIIVTMISFINTANSYIYKPHQAHFRNTIIDERIYYTADGKNTGLSTIKEFSKYYKQPWNFTRFTKVIVHASGLGLMAINNGPETFVIDNIGLGDPLISRLPPPAELEFRAGHTYRKLPIGYVESITENKNLLTDPATHEFYEKIREVTRGELWSWSRFKTIIDLNLHPTPKELVEYYRTQFHP